jgi:hypothetical protein|tara:strand:- start:477 stop:704 length:228 start_codon:yes stop_codon:yes gene_type:complete
MAKDEKLILTEAMVHSATALGIHIVKEIAVLALSQQPGLTMAQFMKILEQHTAQIKKRQTVTTKIMDAPPDVIEL